MMRVGLGYDVHAFVVGRPLVLAGVEIPHDRGLAGHSDADVIAHALIDAILGALRAEDIGAHFPSTDPQYEGVSSLTLLARVGALMRERGWRLADADVVASLELPRISPFRGRMRERLAASLDVPVESIGLKATTTEKLGFTGREEGVAAWAVVLLEKE
jgi:2-C-methyl-D-erythritol 2,4-cyclodiphosphate synthase